MLDYILIFINILITSGAQLLLKKGSLRLDQINFASVLSNFHLLGGVFFYGASFLLWMYILKRVPLSLAYPSLSLGYILVAFLSAKYLGESLTLSKIAGSLIIILGVIVLFKK